jgi:integrase/recombinase XerD
MKTFIDPNLLQRLRVGPLAPYLDAYLKHIEQEGFVPSSAPMQMYAIARFSKWLRDRQFDLHQVDEAAVNRFLKRDPGVVHSCESATLRRLLAMLRQIGVTVAKASEPGTCHQRFIVDYRRYLLRERGLAEATLVYFVRFAEQFLSARFGNGDLNLSELCAKDVTDFVQNRAHQLSPGRAKLLVTALRSLLRYMRHQGEIPIDLATCVLPVAMLVSFYPPQVSTGRHSSTASRSSRAGNPTGKKELRGSLAARPLGSESLRDRCAGIG